MILYLDTSALVKRYFKEEYSNEVISRWQEAEEIVTSSPEDFLFVCFDNKLALAAHEEGLIAFPDLTR